MTRRAFLGRAGSLLVLAAIPAACGGGKKQAGATSTATTATTETTGRATAIFRLSTSDGACSGPRCACGACQRHADSKLFASHEAADGGRAHVHCNCTVVEDSLPDDRWQKLFGPAAKPDRTAVDRRDPNVASILA